MLSVHQPLERNSLRCQAGSSNVAATSSRAAFRPAHPLRTSLAGLLIASMPMSEPQFELQPHLCDRRAVSVTGEPPPIAGIIDAQAQRDRCEHRDPLFVTSIIALATVCGADSVSSCAGSFVQRLAIVACAAAGGPPHRGTSLQRCLAHTTMLRLS